MKRRHKFNLILLTMITILLISACFNNKTKSDASVTTSTPSGQIYLYGESHGVEEILNKEVELWCDYYHNENMRHLFIEMPYYTAEFLNIWMQSDSNDILDLVPLN